jgi:hypothetical protein
MRYAIILCLLAVSILPVQAAPQAAQPTDSSVEEMLKCLQVEKLLTQALAQMTNGMNKAMEQRLQSAVGGRELTPAQKAAIEQFRKTFTQTLQEDLSPAKVRGIYLQCYKETFTQDEVDGIIAFYKSPGGQAISEKYPQVMQKAQTMMQARIAPMSTKVQTAMDLMIKELENTQKALAPTEAPKKP